MKHPVIWAALVAAVPAWADDAQTIVITGNPLGSQVTPAASVLSGEDLVRRRGSSLGETLDRLPGVASSHFGPNASRPTIRGQDGDRIRVLSNAGASLDASSLSFDHAVPIEPLVVERIEVLRGPAALMYGGSAVGGVVNAIDHRIPRAANERVSGAVEMRVGGAARERSVSARVEAGVDGLALHADAFGRETGDLRVPSFERPLGEGAGERRTRVANSSSRARGGALGASHVWRDGYLGASVDTYRNDYGIVVEDDIHIRLRRDKLALAGEWRALGGFFPTLRAQAATTDYEHQEIEGGGEIGTVFKTRGADARLEALHRALPLGAGRMEGTLGLQLESSRFSALGEEAFVPATRTRQAAAFLLERWSWQRHHLSAGVRAEAVSVDSAGDAPDGDPRFGPPQRRDFSPRSASVGAVAEPAAGWQASASWAYTERAPTSYELYADGVHAATAAYERGDPHQAKERGHSIDLALAWQRGPHRAKLSVFDSRFGNYIALEATGEPDVVDDAGESVPVHAFRGVRARLWGAEAEFGWRLLDDGARTVDLDAAIDLVRGRNRDRGEPLARIAPLRATVGVDVAQGPWAARVELQHAARQSRVPSTDVATAAWTVLNLEGSYRREVAGHDLLLFARLRNVGDRLGYHATAVRTVRALSPLAGRALSAGLRVSF